MFLIHAHPDHFLSKKRNCRFSYILRFVFDQNQVCKKKHEFYLSVNRRFENLQAFIQSVRGVLPKVWQEDRWTKFNAQTWSAYLVSILNSESTMWHNYKGIQYFYGISSVEALQNTDQWQFALIWVCLIFSGLEKCRQNQFLLRKKTAKRIGMKSLQTSQSRLNLPKS